MKTWTWLGVALIVVAGAGAAAVRFGAAQSVEAARAIRGSIEEFVDEQGITRLPKTYLVTMPFAGRIESIDLVEGDPVAEGQIVARVTPLDLDLELRDATGAVDRVEAAIEENDDSSVEETSLAQTLNFVESMESTVRAAEERVKAGQAKLEYAEKSLARVKELRESKTASEEALKLA